MALLFMDGFDAADTSAKWDINVSSTSSVSTRFGIGRSLGLGSGGSKAVTKYFTASNEIYVGFAASGMYHGSLNNIVFLNIYTDAGLTTQLNVVGNLNGSIAIRRGATQLAVSPAGVGFGSWNYIEFHAKVDPTAGVAELRVNGAVVATFSGNTKNGGTANAIDGIQITNSGSILAGLIDDLYLLDETGGAPYNTYLGDVRIQTLVPDGAGSSTQFTPSSGSNYAAVDELPYSATDYVSSLNSGDRDMYTLTDLTGTPIIHGVQNNVIAKKTDSGSATLKPAIKSGASVYYGSNAVLRTGDVVITDTRSLDPNTSAAWTSAGVNALESGFEVV